MGWSSPVDFNLHWSKFSPMHVRHGSDLPASPIRKFQSTTHLSHPTPPKVTRFILCHGHVLYHYDLMILNLYESSWLPQRALTKDEFVSSTSFFPTLCVLDAMIPISSTFLQSFLKPKIYYQPTFDCLGNLALTQLCL